MLTKLYEIYKVLPSEYQTRLKHELDVIQNNSKGDFLPYFMTLADVCSFCDSNDIPIGPCRGSAGASLVSFLLGITALDPIRYDLPFSRFLSKERLEKSCADIDIDIPKDKRHLVTDYVFKKYGDRAALVAAFSMQKLKNSLQDSWRLNVIQPTQFEIKQFSKTNTAKAATIETELKQKTQYFDSMRKSLGAGPAGRSDLEWLEGFDDDGAHEAGLLETNSSFIEFVKKYPKVYETARELLGIPRQMSTHAAGLVISNIPLYEFCPVMKVDGHNVIAYDKKTVAKLGLVKQDFLGLTTLSWINDAFDLIGDKELIKKKWDLPDDDDVYKEFVDGKCTSVFQWDTVGGSAYAKKLQPKCKKDIFAGVALNRPGALDGMVQMEDGTEKSAADVYILRKTGKLPVRYLHDDLRPMLEETLGVIVYQEQVMKIIQVLLGFSEAESDVIRGAISDKSPKGFDAVKERLPKLKERGWSDEQITNFFDQIIAFSKYSFNCIAEGQLIRTDVGMTPIEKIVCNINDYKVDYLTEAGTILQENPIFGKYMGEKEVYDIELEDGSSFSATADHKFFINNEWIDLKTILEIYTHMEVYDEDYLKRNLFRMKKLKITSITKRVSKVYDIEMPSAHNFLLKCGAAAHNCSHSAGYGLVSYTTAYLKNKHPLEWWASVLTHSEPNEIIEKMWSEVSSLMELPDVNVSGNKFVINNGKLIPPLKLISNVGPKAVNDIASKAPFSDINDFVNRIDGRQTNIRCIINLIQAGAMDCLFPGVQTQKEKIKEYLLTRKETEKEFTKHYAEFKDMNPVQEYLSAKAVFPVKIAKLSDAVKNTPEIKLPLVDMSHRICGENMVLPSLRGADPLVTGEIFEKISKNISRHDHNAVDVCVFGYVMSVRRFGYFSKKLQVEKEALELLIDMDNFIVKLVAWPRSTDFAPKIAGHVKEKSAYMFKMRINQDEQWRYGITGLEEIL